MDLISALASLVLFLRLCGICRGSEQGNCTGHKLQFERVFSVPGDVAMLHSTLISPDIFDFKTVPYTITWYNSASGQEITNQTGHILVNEETLWFLNATLSDSGDYVTMLSEGTAFSQIWGLLGPPLSASASWGVSMHLLTLITKTPPRCFRQATRLVIEERLPGECGRPRKAFQSLTKGVNDTLSCPLRDQINKLKSYNITSSIKWYRDCDPIVDRTGSYVYWDTKLNFTNVEFQHKGTYTCTLTFTLGGITGSMSETIDGTVTAMYPLVPQVHEPTNEVIKVQRGFNFSKKCQVFVPGEGKPSVDILWLAREEFIETNTSHRVYMFDQRLISVLPNDGPFKGAWLERLLMFSEVHNEDFYTNYTCRVYSDRGFPERYFTLQPPDPNIILVLGCVLGGVMVLIMIPVIVHYLFKFDGVL